MRFRFLSPQLTYRLTQVYHKVLWVRTWWFRAVYGMQLHPTVRISFKARMDKTNPRQIVVGSHTYVAFDSIILSHDYSMAKHGGVFSKPTKIGKNCFIGCASIVLPGVNIGDGVIVGAGSVVTKDVAPGCVVAGNPARVLRESNDVGPYGRIIVDRDGK